jgi:ribosomal protein S18 acetylase RimI-like enzyme
MMAIERIAKDLGGRSLTLDVGMDNPSANRLYRKLGFIPLSEHPYSGKADIEGIIRMERELL